MEPIPIKLSKSSEAKRKLKKSNDAVQPIDVAIPIESTTNTEDIQNLRSEHVEPIYHDMSNGWRCCFGPIANMACGWPQGSCTALLTIISVIMFIGGIIGVLIYGIVAKNVDVILATLAVCTNGFSFVFGHYLGKSASTSSTRVPTTAVVPAT